MVSLVHVTAHLLLSSSFRRLFIGLYVNDATPPLRACAYPRPSTLPSQAPARAGAKMQVRGADGDSAKGTPRPPSDLESAARLILMVACRGHTAQGTHLQNESAPPELLVQGAPARIVIRLGRERVAAHCTALQTERDYTSIPFAPSAKLHLIAPQLNKAAS